MSKILICSGPVHSGKTTRLQQWVKEQSNIDGILAPVINHKRYLQSIRSGEKHLLEIPAHVTSGSYLEVGPYRFSQQTFLWAQKQLRDCLSQTIEWLVIDEIGPLEMEGRGLEPAVTEILTRFRELKSYNLVLVVRAQILDQVLSHYGLESSEIKYMKL